MALGAIAVDLFRGLGALIEDVLGSAKVAGLFKKPVAANESLRDTRVDASGQRCAIPAAMPPRVAYRNFPGVWNNRTSISVVIENQKM